jgi:hypothetical protein
MNHGNWYLCHRKTSRNMNSLLPWYVAGGETAYRCMGEGALVLKFIAKVKEFSRTRDCHFI